MSEAKQRYEEARKKLDAATAARNEARENASRRDADCARAYEELKEALAVYVKECDIPVSELIMLLA